MVTFVDSNKAEYWVESICNEIWIAPSSYYEHKARERDPDQLPEHQAGYKAGSRYTTSLGRQLPGLWCCKVWRQLLREGIGVARCTVERLMKKLGMQGVRRGKECWTTISDDLLDRPTDKVNRQFVASRPNQLWVADITFVATWIGFVYVAFITDVFARYIVGWRVSRTLRTNLVLDALEQALWTRRETSGLIHHSDRGSQYLSIRYTERLAQANIDASVGSIGDSYDNAMAETINGLYKTEVIRHRGPWRSIEEVEFATLEWVDWFNNRRLLDTIGYVPPAEFETAYHHNREESADAT